MNLAPSFMIAAVTGYALALRIHVLPASHTRSVILEYGVYAALVAAGTVCMAWAFAVWNG